MKKNKLLNSLNNKSSNYNLYKKEKKTQHFNSFNNFFVVKSTAISEKHYQITKKIYRHSFQTYSIDSKHSNFKIWQNQSLRDAEHHSKLFNVDSQKTYWNQCFDKGRLKNFVLWFFRNNGEHKTIQLVEEFKNLGFQYATKAGISLGIDDLKIPPKKALLIYSAEKETASAIKQYKRGDITGVERFQCLIDTWHRTSEQLKQEVIDNFEATDVLNPVYMMAFSGARGNISQVRQLVGMRGLMSNPQGQIIDFPIRSNFREGLTLTEYIISSYGARKGIVDTALRTANAGYLTRRLVDVAQHVIISNFDCGTRRGIFLKDMKEGNKTIVSLNTRLIGRVCGTDIYANNDLNGLNNNQNLIAKRNQEISIDLAFEISKVTKKVFVRSALTCETKKLVCQLCYGWSLAQGNLVSIGEAIGVIAAQSIGEPGTQLTMRTFHTGGVFSGDVSDQIRMPFDGMIIYNAPIAGTLIRTPEGKIAFLTKAEGSFTICQISESSEETLILKKLSEIDDVGFTSSKLTSILPKGLQTKKFKIPSYTLLYAKNGDIFNEKEVVAQISSISKQKNATDEAELTIKSEIDGQLHINYLELKENKVGPKLTKKEKEQEDSLDNIENPLLQNSNILTSLLSEKKKNQYLLQKNGPTNLLESFFEAWNWGNAWVLSGKIYHSPTPSPFFPEIGDYINTKSIMNGPNNLKYISMVSGDAKLEFFSNLLPKYLQTKTLKNSQTENMKVLNNHDKSIPKFNAFRSNLEKNHFPSLNKEFLNFSIQNLQYKTIGYYLNLKESVNYKTLNPFISTRNFSTKKIEMKKYLIQNKFLNSNDSIFVIPENRQILINNSLLKLYPSNWQPEYKTIIQWFPSKLNISTNGILVKEENPQSQLFRKKKNYQSLLLINKNESLFSCHKNFLRQKARVTKKEKSQIQLKLLCLRKNLLLQHLKMKEIQNKTTEFEENSKMNLNLKKYGELNWGSSHLKVSQSQTLKSLNTNLKFKESSELSQLMESNFSRLFFFPKLIRSSSNTFKVSKSQTLKKEEKFVKIIQEVLQKKLSMKKNYHISSSSLKNSEKSKQGNFPQITNLKSFCLIYFHSLKNIMELCPSKVVQNQTLQKSLWVYLLPKKAVINKKLAFSSHTKYLLYPGQLSPFEVSFENQLIAVFPGSIKNESFVSSNFIQIKNKKFNLNNWIGNKKCRYVLNTKNVLTFPGQPNNFLPKSTKNYQTEYRSEEYNVFIFQKVNELNLNVLKNSPKRNLKNEIYEISKSSDNPLNGLYKIKLDSKKISKNLLQSFDCKISGIPNKLNFTNKRIYGSVKVFTNSKQNSTFGLRSSKVWQSQTLKNQHTKVLNKQKAIQKLNHLFSISPDFDSGIRQNFQTKNSLTQPVNFISKDITRKSLKKLIKKSLFNQSYLSLTQYQLLKSPTLNKQESVLQILSKYPNIDIEIVPQIPKSLKFNNLIFGSQTHSSIAVDQKAKIEIKPQLTYGFIAKNINVFPFYITIQLEQQKRKFLGLKNSTKDTHSEKKSAYKLFDYPFKDYKISFTPNSSQYLSKVMKNYLIQILFTQSFIRKSNNLFDLNGSTTTKVWQSQTLKTNVTNINNNEIQNVVKIAKFRSMIGYSLEEFFNNDPTNIKVKSSSFSDSKNKDKGCEKTTIQYFKNQSLSKIKFYGNSNYRISQLVPFARSFTFSPFEGEIIKITSPYLLGANQKNSLKENLYLENKTISLQQKQHISIFLTKQDLISYNFRKSKAKNNLKSFNEIKTFSDNVKIPSQSKNYLIKDIILPISSDLLNPNESVQNSTENVVENDTNTLQIKKIYQIPDLVGGFPISKSNQNKVLKSPSFNLEKNIKKFSSNLKILEQKRTNLINGKDLKLSSSNIYQIGDFIVFGDKILPPNVTNEELLLNNYAVSISGQIIHINNKKLTIRKGQPLFISPKSILHKLDGDFIESKSPVITLSYQRLKTGDIVQGIPKIEQFFEARTTKRGRLFRDSLPNLLKALFKRYLEQMPLDKAVRQSFYKIQQIIVDGVLRVYRSQGVTISDKHLEIIVKQMTAKVRILEGGQTGFFPGEVVDLDFVEQVNELLMKKIQYEPLVLGITKSSLEVESFLSAASFQQTTRVLSQAAIARKKDFLKGLKENVILGNLIPAGTGYLVYLEDGAPPP